MMRTNLSVACITVFVSVFVMSCSRIELNDALVYDPVCGEGHYILTPETSALPRINGPEVFGVRPGNPFLYTVPVTGKRPMKITVAGLPEGLSANEKGMISGTIRDKTERRYTLKFFAENDLGKSEKEFDVIVGEDITLTPPMGWSSWIATKKTLNQKKVLANVDYFMTLKLNNYGFTYINIDDCWQGSRGGEFNAIQPDPERFSDIKGMVDHIHSLGLKAGIYSTPWVSSYAGFVGGSSNHEQGYWDKSMKLDFKETNAEERVSWMGDYKFDTHDAKQWAEWGFDYMKYDWRPNDEESIVRMADALRNCGRDIVFAISNNCPISQGPNCEKYVQVFRTGGDIRARWDEDGSHINLLENWDNHKSWLVNGFEGKPGHIPDPDFLMVGLPKYGSDRELTADELYHHVSSFILWGGPLLLSCHLENLTDFDESLMKNVEMLDIHQDRLAKPARCAYSNDGIQVLIKDLADGEKAIGIFNFNSTNTVAALKWNTLGLSGKKLLRDVWRQQDIGIYGSQFRAKVRPHGVIVVRTRSIK